MKPVRRWWLCAAGALLLATAIAAFAPLHDWTELIEERLDSMSLGTGLLVFCAIYVVGTLLLVPAWIFAVAAGAVFGFAWGMLAAVVSSTLAALAAFLATRHGLRGPVERAARRNETFKAVDKAVRREPWKVVALLRLSPVLPSGLKSYFLGLTCIDPLPYTLATALGMLPGLAVKVYLGHAGRAALGGGGASQWGLFALGIGATLAMAFVVSRAARKHLKLQ
jgi:uncharacterized membrane protein YdjX (TVP38/TMEM64 family)